MKLQTLLDKVSPRGFAAAAVLWILTLPFAFFVAVPHRAIELWSFTIPCGFILIFLSRRGFGWRAAAFAGFLVSWLDLAVRGYIWETYQGDPRAGFVKESIGNTNFAEASEYVMAAAHDILPWAVVVGCLVLCCLALIFWASRARTSKPLVGGKRTAAAAVLSVLAVVSAASVVISPWRAQCPVIYWTRWAMSVGGMRSYWAKLDKERAAMMEVARDEVMWARSGDHTIVLVLGESVVRDQMSVYGYGRTTTPQLELIEAGDPKLAVVRHVWSLAANTVDAFRSLFGIETPQGETNLFAMLRAAGYNLYWLSNQNDFSIRNTYSKYASRIEIINPFVGRSSTSLDGNLIEPLIKTLREDISSKRLIVLHMIGIHPHYALRYPEAWEPEWGKDKVTQELEALGRSDSVISSRDNYDTAMLYQDEVIAGMFRAALAAARPGERLDWIYISDHGQEVGDNANRTGHSPKTNDGYRVPFLYWSNTPFGDPEDLEKRPFRTDRLTPTILSLSGIVWKSYDEGQDFLSPNYVWEMPKIPASDAELDKVTEEWGTRKP